MRSIRFGNEDFEGNFTYLFLPEGHYAGEEVLFTSYYLIGYGSKHTLGKDVDGDGLRDNVILVLSSGVSGPVVDEKLDSYPPIAIQDALRLATP